MQISLKLLFEPVHCFYLVNGLLGHFCVFCNSYFFISHPESEIKQD